ncbi:DUF3820 family protein [Hydrotalea sp.]|uniref:DUF3820 family protein n=1 Tax=Hydrotalea sp. TaxID=2881279 RepID=UPI00260F371A|nr:DUF3820 family protein [Hydrotalea sp.]
MLAGDPSILQDLVRVKMPFGKYKDQLICQLPVAYLEWFARKGFPKGQLGILLETMYEIQLNGIAHLLIPFKQ